MKGQGMSDEYQAIEIAFERTQLDHHLTRRVWPVPTDPAEVVAELRRRAKKIREQANGSNSAPLFEEHAIALLSAADLVAAALGVGNG